MRASLHNTQAMPKRTIACHFLNKISLITETVLKLHIFAEYWKQYSKVVLKDIKIRNNQRLKNAFLRKQPLQSCLIEK
ncbi:hypothetical protein T05_11386 [Trichinella murrelli]|uniref:Uncharacterized protein n=1 Tax=Trichinella murrelli TaxID=144512 RepID=A0A0V0TIA3_9BILA|nr:hypothetical protein T05_11386 [Trichinella murrelli]